MGLGTWWMTHGPGSPGATAKAMASSYSRLRMAYPSASNVQLLSATLQSRYPDIDDSTAVRLIDECEGSLTQLVLIVIHSENSTADKAMANAPAVYLEMLKIVKDVVQEYAPGA